MYFCIIDLIMMNLVDFIKELATESINILLQPKKYWLGIKYNKNATVSVFTKIFLPGLVFIFFSIVIGDVFFESEYGLLFNDTLIKATRVVLLLLFVCFASTMLMYEISRIFNIAVTFDNARKIVIYSMMPLVLVTILIGVFPFLSAIEALGLYSFYLIYTATVTVFDIKPNRNIPYLVILISSIFVAYILIAYLLSKLTALIIY